MNERFCYAGQQKTSLRPVSSQVAFRPTEKPDQAAISSIVDALKSLEMADQIEQFDSFNVSLMPIRPEVDDNSLANDLDSLINNEQIESILPIFQMPDGNDDEFVILQDTFRAQLKKGATEEELLKLNKKHHVNIVSKEDLGQGSYLLQVGAKATKDALDLANLYHTDESIDYAEPDWIFLMNKLTVRVNDPLEPRQWGLLKMRVQDAWRINQGSELIKIAIIDEGVQTSHPDLKDKIYRPYDAITNSNRQDPNPWDGHGTACAGIAGAVTNNRLGVAGVAPNCKILPVRIAMGRRNARGWITSTTIIARGLREAVNRGADVLSNSWGGGPYSSTIRNVLQYAIQSGRSGKGCVVISASGNADIRNISYPAKYEESLACGASNQWDQRKSRTSRDGENWWGSQYGEELDFIAPGVKIPTTDISGGDGYGPGDYINDFNGTSSATPNAAGVAALVVSVDPNLKHWEVADILKLSAHDLGTRGRDEQHGWGRIDALSALRAARKLWYETKLKLDFIGVGKECFMRFESFRLFNSGINRIRLNSFTIRSYDPLGNVIDEFKYIANPGGIMQPGLSPGGGSGHEVIFKDILLKANGTQSKWNYRWRAFWGFTYWRPSGSVTQYSALSTDVDYVEMGDNQFEVTIEGPTDQEYPPEITFEQPPLKTNIDSQEENNTSNSQSVHTGNGQQVKVTVIVDK